MIPTAIIIRPKRRGFCDQSEVGNRFCDQSRVGNTEIRVRMVLAKDNRFSSRMLPVANFIPKNQLVLLDGVRARLHRVVLARTGRRRSTRFSRCIPLLLSASRMAGSMRIEGRVLSSVAVQRIARSQCAWRDDFGNLLSDAHRLVCARTFCRPTICCICVRAPFARGLRHAIRLLAPPIKKGIRLDGGRSFCTQLPDSVSAKQSSLSMQCSMVGLCACGA